MFTVTNIAGSGKATAINVNGVVVCASENVGVAWIPNQRNGTDGTVYTLPNDLSPGYPVTPLAVNATGMVVGVCKTEDVNGAAVDRAFSFQLGSDVQLSLWEIGTFVEDPAYPGSFLGNSAATGVNDSGINIVSFLECRFDPNNRFLKINGDRLKKRLNTYKC